MKKFSVLKKIEEKITNKSNKISSFPTEMQAPLIDANLKVLLPGLHILKNKIETILDNSIINADPSNKEETSTAVNFMKLRTFRAMIKECDKLQVITSSNNTNLLAYHLDESYDKTLKSTKSLFEILSRYEKQERLGKLDVDLIKFLKQAIEFDILTTTKMIEFNAKFLDKQKHPDRVNAKEF